MCKSHRMVKEPIEEVWRERERGSLLVAPPTKVV
jgi:hypothetical protein